MACFLVSAAEAVVTTVVTHAVEKKEKAEELKVSVEHKELPTEVKIPFSRKLKWLNNMLWGGSALLAFEHIWHGEVTPWFPFLTNAATPEQASEMLHEMATNGVAMAVLVTLAWIAMVCISISLSKKSITTEKTSVAPGKKEA